MSAPANSDRTALTAVLSPIAEETVKPSSNRTFGFVFAAFFTLVALLPLVRHHAIRLWALPVAALFFWSRSPPRRSLRL